MARYRKKPVEVEAFQMTRERRWDNSEWPEWLNKAWNKAPSTMGAAWPGINGIPGVPNMKEDWICLGTLEGVHIVDWDDWIIQGIKGELYPCKPDIFEMTYEPA